MHQHYYPIIAEYCDCDAVEKKLSKTVIDHESEAVAKLRADIALTDEQRELLDKNPWLSNVLNKIREIPEDRDEN